MKGRWTVTIMVILSLTVFTHALLALNCQCDTAFQGMYAVTGPSAFSCRNCSTGIGYRWDCDSQQTCNKGWYCTGGCSLTCWCYACTTWCTTFFACPCP
jgi:hypothetical protein